MSQPDAKSPTREELEKMCPDKRTVRHFELLFAQVRDLEQRLQEAEAAIEALTP